MSVHLRKSTLPQFAHVDHFAKHSSSQIHSIQVPSPLITLDILRASTARLSKIPMSFPLDAKSRPTFYRVFRLFRRGILGRMLRPTLGFEIVFGLTRFVSARSRGPSPHAHTHLRGHPHSRGPFFSALKGFSFCFRGHVGFS